eukprot:3633233-Amphidinium_carterae.1
MHVLAIEAQCVSVYMKWPPLSTTCPARRPKGLNVRNTMFSMLCVMLWGYSDYSALPGHAARE